jgi:hypothetical protein
MPFPASGGGVYMRFTPKIIRFQRHGCTNRPFFHIVVMEVSNNMHMGDRNFADCTVPSNTLMNDMFKA